MSGYNINSRGTPKASELAAILRSTRYVTLCNSTEFHTHLILTPPVSNCCDCRLTPRYRPSLPLVYTSTGTYTAASYHSYCQTCSTTYYPYKLSELQYLQISSQTGFEIQYLNNVTNQLSICSSNLDSRRLSVSSLLIVYNLAIDSNFKKKFIFDALEIERTKT